jgi:hypothetical protein
MLPYVNNFGGGTHLISPSVTWERERFQVSSLEQGHLKGNLNCSNRLNLQMLCRESTHVNAFHPLIKGETYGPMSKVVLCFKQLCPSCQR